MSMTLLLWKTPVVDDPEDAEALLEPYYASDDESEESPWSDPPMTSDRAVTLDIRWGVDDAVLDEILGLARRYELVLYDPQGPDIHCPPWTADDAEYERPPTSMGEYARILGLAGIGVLLVLGGWFTSIPVLSWLVIALS